MVHVAPGCAFFAPVSSETWPGPGSLGTFMTQMDVYEQNIRRFRGAL